MDFVLPRMGHNNVMQCMSEFGGQNRRSADSYYYSSDITVLPVTAYPVEKLENLMRQNFSQTAFLPNL